MPKLLMVALAILVGWMALTLSTVKTQTSFIRESEERLQATRSALTGTQCIQCHGADSGNTLPIRKTLDKSSFTKHIRGLGPFHGFTTCPPYDATQFSDADISKVYRILYGK
jgi:mono/diheme cytochrome c family protein